MRPSLLAAVVVLSSFWGASGRVPSDDFAADRSAKSRIEALGGTIIPDSTNPDVRGVAVLLSKTPITDDDLLCLKSIKHISCLNLAYTAITDSGLEHVKPMVDLRTLSLNGTDITDEGLRNLAGLRNLKSLQLTKTKIQ